MQVWCGNTLNGEQCDTCGPPGVAPEPGSPSCWGGRGGNAASSGGAWGLTAHARARPEGALKGPTAPPRAEGRRPSQLPSEEECFKGSPLLAPRGDPTGVGVGVGKQPQGRG